jgi:hypothetical protein
VRTRLLHLLAAAFAATWAVSASAQIELIGVGAISSDLTDLSGLAENQLGTFGSAIAYTGMGTIYLGANDRASATNTGTTGYVARVQTFNIVVDPNAAKTERVRWDLLRTTLLTNETGQYFDGNSALANLPLRLDSEGIRVGRYGNTFYISDEMGPFLYEFDRTTGQRIKSLNVPSKFLIDNPRASLAQELTANTKGRQPNRGMEGLAISPDGGTLFGIMQNPLIQDNAIGRRSDGTRGRVGKYLRILKVDVDTGKTQEFVYALENGEEYGVNEILAINDHEFLVLERDGTFGDQGFKKVFKVDITGATDVSGYAELPFADKASDTLSPDIVLVSKTPFLDMNDPSYLYTDFLPEGASFLFPDKPEGLAWGPTLPNGNLLLLISSDNDLSDAPSYLFAYSVDPSLLPGFQPQAVPEPGSLLLLAGLGGVGLLGWKARSRASR